MCFDLGSKLFCVCFDLGGLLCVAMFGCWFCLFTCGFKIYILRYLVRIRVRCWLFVLVSIMLLFVTIFERLCYLLFICNCFDCMVGD